MKHPNKQILYITESSQSKIVIDGHLHYDYLRDVLDCSCVILHELLYTDGKLKFRVSTLCVIFTSDFCLLCNICFNEHNGPGYH